MKRTHLNVWVLLSLVCLFAGFSLLGFAAAKAQDNPAAAVSGTPVAQDEVNAVAKQLWCPLCSNVRLDSCELKACSQMKDVIAEKLAAGTDVQQIKDYFVAQYGPQVLGEPPLEGFNWLAWLLPVAVFIGGAVFIWSRARRMVRSSQTDDAAAIAAEKAAPPSGDEYAEKLDKELKQYD